MSQEIDDKVVEIRFDNKAFEKNVASTIETIEKLKTSLNFKDSAKAFNDIESAAKKVNFDGLIQAIDSVQSKITSLQSFVASTLDPIEDRFISFGTLLTSTFSNTSSYIVSTVQATTSQIESLVGPAIQQVESLANALSSTVGQAASELGIQVQSATSIIDANVSKSSNGISSSISSILKTVALVAASATVVVTGVVLVSSTARDKIRTIAQNIKENLITTATAIRANISEKTEAIKSTLFNVIGNIENKIQSVTSKVHDFVNSKLESMKSYLSTTMPKLYETIVTTIYKVREKVQSIGEEIHTAISNVISKIKEKINSASNSFDDFKAKISSKFKKGDTGVDEITEELDTLGKSAEQSKQQVVSSVNEIKSSVEELKSSLSDIDDGSSIEHKVETVSKEVTDKAEEVKESVKEAEESVSSEAEEAAENVSKSAEQVGDSFENASEKANDSASIFERIGKIGETLKSKFSEIGSSLPGNLSKVGETLKSTFSSVSEKLPSKFTDISSKIKDCVTHSSKFGKTISTVVSTGLPLLSKFKNSLKGSSDETANSKSSMLNLGDAVNTVSKRFTSLGLVAKGALEDIGRNAKNTLVQLLKSLTTDNLEAGWTKFGNKTTSVGTLVGQGYELEEVNKQLENLNWFTDETSYNFTDMVKEISKFTATGQTLDDSVTAMKGIASWAALSGQNATTASSAMYQLSQAMGSGAMRKEDYKSIQNASMDTMEFRQHAIDAAVALGTLRDNADGTYTSIVNGASQSTFTIQQFAENLTEEQWFTSDVMMSVFKEYGKASNTIMAYMDKYSDDINTASEAMDDIEAKAKEFQKEMKAAGEEITLDEALKKVSLDELKEIPDIVKEAEDYMSEFNETLEAGQEPISSIDEALEKLGYGLDEFSLKALRSGQEARTWQDAIDSVKDAVSTGWMNTFELIFGDYEEAKNLWTTVANELYDVFASGAEARNEVIGAWKELGGRESLLKSVSNTWEALKNIIDTIKDAFHEIFPTADAQKLVDMTKKVEEITEKFKMSDETVQKLKTTFSGLFAAVDIVKQIFVKLFNTIKPLFNFLPGAGDGILDLTSNFGEFLVKVDEYLKTNPSLQSALEAISGIFSKVSSSISSGLAKIGSFGDTVKSVFETVKSVISQAFSFIGNAIKDYSSNIKSYFNIAVVGLAIKKFFNTATKTTTKFGSFFKNISKQVSDILESVKGCLESFQKDIKANTLLKIAAAVGILAVSILILASIDPARLGTSLAALTVSFGELMGAMELFSKISGKADADKMKSLTLVMIGVSAAVYILASALKKIGSMETEDVVEGIIGVSVLMTALVLVCKSLSKIEGEIVKGMAGILAFSFAILILSKAVKSLGSLNVETLAKGLVGVGVLLLEMVAVIKIISKIDSKGMISACFAMILMSVALKLAVSSVAKLGSLPTESLIKGLIGVAAVLGIFTGVVAILSLLKDQITLAIPGAFAMIILAVALRLAAKPFMEIGKMSWEQIAKGFVGLYSILGTFMGITILCAALEVYVLAAIPGAISMVVLAIALKAAVGPFQAIGSMSWEQIAKGFVGMLAILGLFTGIVAICAALSVAVPAAIPGAIAIVTLAMALKIAIGPFQELGNMRWDQIEKGATGIIALLGTLSILGALLGVLSPAIIAGSVALIAIGLSFKIATAALSSGLDSIAECITKMATIKPKEFTSAIASISAGLALLGVALMAFNPLSIIGAASVLILSEALLKLAPALLMLKDATPSEIAAEMSALSVGMAKFGLALKTFGPFALIGASAMSELGTAIAIMAPGIAILSAIPGDDAKNTLETLATAFKNFGEALKETPFWGAKSRAEGIGTLTDSIKSLAESLPTLIDNVDQTKMSSTLTAIGTAFKDFGDALKSTPFWGAKSRGEGVGTLTDSIKSLSESLPALSDISGPSIQTKLTAIGEGFKSFGTALSNTPLFNSKSAGTGISTLVSSISDLASGLESINNIGTNSIRIKAQVTAIGEGFKELSTALNYGPLWGAEGNANSIATLVSSISDLASGLESINNIGTNSIRIKAQVTAIGEAFKEFGAALSSAPLFNSEDKANSIKTVISSLKELVPQIKALSTLELDTETLKGIFTSLGEGVEEIGEAISKVHGKAENKGNALSSVLSSLESFANGIVTLNSVKDDISSITSSFGTAVEAISTAINKFKTDGDSTAFSNTVKSIGDLIPSLRSLSTIDADKIKSNLEAASTAITAFASATEESAEQLESFSTMGSTAATNFTTGYTETIDSASDSFTTSGENVIGGFNTGMGNKKTASTTAVAGIVSACVVEIRKKYTNFYNAGKYLVEGLVKALTSEAAYTDIKEAGKKLVEKAEEGVEEAGGISSPSKVFYQEGLYCVSGFANAFYDNLTASEVVGKELAYNAISGASFALRKASSILENDLNLQPTIRPVIDLSNIQNGASVINGLFGSRHSLSVNTSSRLSALSAATMTPSIEVPSAAKSGNEDIVSAIHILRSDVNALSQKIGGMEVTIDGRKAVGVLAPRMDRALGQTQIKRRKGV